MIFSSQQPENAVSSSTQPENMIFSSKRLKNAILFSKQSKNMNFLNLFENAASFQMFHWKNPKMQFSSKKAKKQTTLEMWIFPQSKQ